MGQFGITTQQNLDMVYTQFKPLAFRPKGRGFLFLHGFPGNFSQALDLATIASHETRSVAWVPDYPGIRRSPGRFSFAKTLASVQSFVSQKVESGEVEKVTLVGHSFGGLVALNTLIALSPIIEKVILIAPLTDLPSVDIIRPLLEGFVERQSSFSKNAPTVDELVGEFITLEGQILPMRRVEAIASTGAPIHLLHGTQDEVLPYQLSQQFCEILKGQARYYESKDNHYLSHRAVVIPQLIDLFLSE